MNVKVAIGWAQRLMVKGHTPFVPHLYHFVHVNWFTSPDEDVWLKICKDWIPFCDAILRLPGASHGADAEVAMAKSLGIPVYNKIEEIE